MKRLWWKREGEKEWTHGLAREPAAEAQCVVVGLLQSGSSRTPVQSSHFGRHPIYIYMHTTSIIAHFWQFAILISRELKESRLSHCFTAWRGSARTPASRGSARTPASLRVDTVWIRFLFTSCRGSDYIQYRSSVWTQLINCRF